MQLFQAASRGRCWNAGADGRRRQRGIADPAERLAVGLRLSGRLAWSHPDIARVPNRRRLGALDTPSGSRRRALRDIRPARRPAVSVSPMPTSP